MYNSSLLEKSIEILTWKIAGITREYATERDMYKAGKLKEKLDFLKSLRKQAYKGNKEVIKVVIMENKNGVI